MKPLEELVHERNRAAESACAERLASDLQCLRSRDGATPDCIQGDNTHPKHVYDQVLRIYLAEARAHGVGDIAAAIRQQALSSTGLALNDHDREQYDQALEDVLLDQERLLRALDTAADD